MKDYRQIITGEEEVSLHFRTTLQLLISSVNVCTQNITPSPCLVSGGGPPVCDRLRPRGARHQPQAQGEAGGRHQESRWAASHIRDIHDNDHDLMTLVQVSAWRGRLSCWAAPPRSSPSTYWAASTGSTPATCTRSAHHHDNMINI